MDTTSAPKIGWIGLGSMGLGMATNLQKYLSANSLPPLSYTNRTLSRGDSIKTAGSIPYSSVGEVAQHCDITFSSVSDDAVLISLVDNFITSGDIAGKVLVDTSTVHPQTTSVVALKLSKAGAIFIAAPVFGASPAAAAGTVLFAAAGPTDAIVFVLPYLNAMGRKVLRVGDQPSKALILKTTSNFLMAGIMELVAEGLVFAEKQGLSIDAVEELLQENFGPVVYSDSRRMTTGVYAPPKGQQPWSEVGLAIKDVGHGLEMAEKEGYSLPVGSLALKHLTEAKKWGENQGRTLDSTSIYGIVRQEAGLHFETEIVLENCKHNDGMST